MTERILILGAQHRQAAAIVRSLARAGYEPVLGRDGRRRSLMERSHYAGRVWPHPPTTLPDRFFEALLDAIRAGEFSRILPVGEKQLRLLASRPDLPSDLLLAARPETITTCLDKTETHRIAAAAGLPVPTQVVARDLDGLAEAARHVGFPCVIKPESSELTLRHHKALICNDADAVRASLPEWPPDHDILLVQACARGYRHNCNVIAIHGKLTEYCEVVVYRTDCADGTGHCVDGATVPPTAALVEHCRRLVESLGYSGPAGIQFIVDPDSGEATFLEINPRFDAVIALPYHAGCDLPRMAVEQLCRPSSSPTLSLRPYRQALRIHWLVGDLAGLRRAQRRGELTYRETARWLMGTVWTLVRARCHVTWEWRDPLPGLLALSRIR